MDYIIPGFACFLVLLGLYAWFTPPVDIRLRRALYGFLALVAPYLTATLAFCALFLYGGLASLPYFGLMAVLLVLFMHKWKNAE